ncbi:MAG: DUF1549 domain-containing protein, partial [Verrucomicrobiota bacterium]
MDDWVLGHLQERGMKPLPRASRETLIRRLSLDLTGLPPEPAAVDAFLADTGADAYERLVDRLLASKHYGERMALAWMDVARYGDTDGLNADAARYMWTWRDWVVRAYNTNMPFDRFLEEQMAGDLLPNPTRDQLIATGFHRNNVTSDEGGAIPEELRVQYVVDRVKASFNAFQALSVECAQCHDHKYDPISQEEYFGLFAFFNSASDPGLQTRKQNQAPYIAASPEFASEKVRELNRELDALKTQRSTLQPPDAEFQAWFETVRTTAGGLVAAGDWYTIGNFSAGAGQDIAEERIPIGVGAPDLNQRHRSFRWRSIPEWHEGSFNNVHMHQASSRYYYRRLTAPADVMVNLTVPTDSKVWLNGTTVKRSKGKGSLALTAGESHLIVKVTNKNDGMRKLTFSFDPPVMADRVVDALRAETVDGPMLAEIRSYYRKALWKTWNQQQALMADRTAVLDKLLAKGHSTMV